MVDFKYSEYYKRRMKEKLDEKEKKDTLEKEKREQKENFWRKSSEPKKSEEKHSYKEPVLNQNLIDKKVSVPVREEIDLFDVVKEKMSYTKINKPLIIFGSLLLITGLIIALVYISSPQVEIKYQPFDVVVANSTGMPMNVYYQDERLLTLTGWESVLEYQNTTDRVVGNSEYKKLLFDNKGNAYTSLISGNTILIEPLKSKPDNVTRIGWFTDSDFDVYPLTLGSEKKVLISLSEDSGDIQTSSLDYTFYKGEPYFKMGFSADSRNNSNLGNFGYGLVLSNYNVYLSNGTILENNNNVTILNKTVKVLLKDGRIERYPTQQLIDSLEGQVDLNRSVVERKGSSYRTNSAYQLFYNEEEGTAIIAYAKNVSYFENSFYWNVYRVYVPYNSDSESYPELYIMVLENAALIYDPAAGNWKGDWKVNSDQYSGEVMDYIKQVTNTIQ